MNLWALLLSGFLCTGSIVFAQPPSSPIHFQVANCGDLKPRIESNYLMAMQTAKSCLRSLGPQGHSHWLALLGVLTGSHTIHVACGNPTEDWTDTHAHATLPGDSKYPSMELNPITIGRRQDLDLQQTLLHETFHLTGHRHFTGVEYAYACAQCCMKDYRPDSMACQICAMPPSAYETSEYFKKIHRLMTPYYGDKFASMGLIQKIHAGAPSEFHTLLLSFWANSESAPLAIALAEELTQRRGYLLPEEQASVDSIRLFRGFLSTKALLPLARHLVGVHFALLENNEKLAEDIRELAGEVWYSTPNNGSVLAFKQFLSHKLPFPDMKIPEQPAPLPAVPPLPAGLFQFPILPPPPANQN